jgi:hypothetical protein
MTLDIQPGDTINFRHKGKIYRRKVRYLVGATNPNVHYKGGYLTMPPEMVVLVIKATK